MFEATAESSNFPTNDMLDISHRQWDIFTIDWCGLPQTPREPTDTVRQKHLGEAHEEEECRDASMDEVEPSDATIMNLLKTTTGVTVVVVHNVLQQGESPQRREEAIEE